ncbi:Mite allergen Lep d 7 [Frankliniella fusca]|uniref:Mite allergen Lep d 7 n=1 Tax=Frankliniella fusca TaxID=407009 RepID=A0AAE1LGQ8_9NEOP|nr:Mite allergen Lep d 7 [Frankliniella fusca]
MQLGMFLVLAAFSAAASGLQIVEEFSQDKRAANLTDSSYNIDKIVDILMALVKVEVESRGLNQIPLPDFQEDFKKRVGPIKVKGYFKGWSGWAKSLGTLHRSGEAVVIVQNGDRVVLQIPLSFGDLQLGYQYQAKLKRVASTSGHVRATVQSNALTLKASAVLSDTECSAAVDSIELTDLGKIKVKATGLGPLNFLLNKIATWVAKRTHSKIEEAAKNGLKQAIDKAGLKFNCS